MRTDLLVAAAVAVLVSGCSNSTNAPKGLDTPSNPAAPAVTAGDLVGKWVLDQPNGEAYYLTLFESGVMGFQHVGQDLPISRAFGSWSLDGSTLRISVAGHDPDPFPLPVESSVARSPEKKMVLGGATAWGAVDAPWGGEPGLSARRASDERTWTQLIEQAKQ